jgi:hypothetical protein
VRAPASPVLRAAPGAAAVFGPSEGLLFIESAMRWRGKSTSVTVT